MTVGERPNKTNIESLNLTWKVNIFRFWRGNTFLWANTTFLLSVATWFNSLELKDFLCRNPNNLVKKKTMYIYLKAKNSPFITQLFSLKSMLIVFFEPNTLLKYLFELYKHVSIFFNLLSLFSFFVNCIFSLYFLSF